MRRLTIPLLLAALLLLPTAPAGASTSAAPGATLADGGPLDASGRYIVTMRKGADPAVVRDRQAGRSGLHADLLFRKAISGFAGRLNAAQVRSLRLDPDVEAIVPDEKVEVASQSVPTGVSRIGDRLSSVARIDGIDDRVDADVAIVDTGIDASHPDLNVVGGMNCSSTDTTAWGDGNGHGTHVAGTVGAKDNGIGVVGVAPGVRLWAVRILNSDGSGLLSWYICGLDWITAQRDPLDASRPLIEAVNMSVAKWGSDDGNCGFSNADVLHQAICRLTSAGVTVVAAAANDSGNAAKRVPAAYNEVITVSALADTDGKAGGLGGNRCYSWGTYDVDDSFADFSNYGGDIDLIAPGKCIWSTRPGNTYAYSSGTSMAAPHVTGAVALYKASRAWATPTQVKAALQYLGNTGWRTWTDPDSVHERLLDAARIGPFGDFSVSLTSPIAAGPSGGARSVPVSLHRSTTHFEAVRLSASLPAGMTGTFVAPSLMGFSANTTTLSVTVPAGTPVGSYPIVVNATDGVHGHSATIPLVVESDLPTAAPASAQLIRPQTLGRSSAVVAVSWPAASDATSAIAGYQLQLSVDGGTWGGTVATSAAVRSFARVLPLGHEVRFRIRAQDTAGNWSPWLTGRAVRLRAIDDRSTAIHYSAGWARAPSSYALAGTLTYASRSWTSLQVTVTARQIGLVAPTSRTRGQLRIYLDGAYQGTISLYSRVSHSRQLVWLKSFEASGTHRLVLRPVGTAGRPRIDVDAIVTAI